MKITTTVFSKELLYDLFVPQASKALLLLPQASSSSVRISGRVKASYLFEQHREERNRENEEPRGESWVQNPKDLSRGQ